MRPWPGRACTVAACSPKARRAWGVFDPEVIDRVVHHPDAPGADDVFAAGMPERAALAAMVLTTLSGDA